jgi:hypothetical protein
MSRNEPLNKRDIAAMLNQYLDGQIEMLRIGCVNIDASEALKCAYPDLYERARGNFLKYLIEINAVAQIDGKLYTAEVNAATLAEHKRKIKNLDVKLIVTRIKSNWF